jgi:hypothetical protein
VLEAEAPEVEAEAEAPRVEAEAEAEVLKFERFRITAYHSASCNWLDVVQG